MMDQSEDCNFKQEIASDENKSDGWQFEDNAFIKT